MKKNRELRRQKKDPKMIVEDEEKNATETSEVDAAEKPKTKRTRSKQASIFNEQGHTLPKAEIIRQRKAERARRDQEMIFVTKDRFQKIDALDKQIGPSVRGAEKHLMREYIKTAQELWDDISSITAFYPRKIVSFSNSSSETLREKKKTPNTPSFKIAKKVSRFLRYSKRKENTGSRNDQYRSTYYGQTFASSTSND